MITIDDPPTKFACASCAKPLHWLYSARRHAWVAFVPSGDLQLTVHGCKHAQDAPTWRDVRRVDPATAHRGRALVDQVLNATKGRP